MCQGDYDWLCLVAPDPRSKLVQKHRAREREGVLLGVTFRTRIQKKDIHFRIIYSRYVEFFCSALFILLERERVKGLWTGWQSFITGVSGEEWDHSTHLAWKLWKREICWIVVRDALKCMKTHPSWTMYSIQLIVRRFQPANSQHGEVFHSPVSGRLPVSGWLFGLEKNRWFLGFSWTWTYIWMKTLTCTGHKKMIL